MINRVLGYIALCLFLISCTSGTILEQPDDLIPQDKMEDILTDMFISASGERVANRFDEKNNKCFNVICRKYDIDSTQFKKSNYYYTSQIDTYTTILKNVKKKLEHKRDSVRQIIKVNDSIRMTLREKYNKISKDRIKLGTYETILNAIYSLQVTMNKKQDSLAILEIPLSIKTPAITNLREKWYQFSFYNAIDTLAYQNKIVSKEDEIEVLERLKEKLNNNTDILEIEKLIKSHKDSVLSIKRLLQMDTILHFPLVNKNKTLKYSDVDRYTTILSQKRKSFKNQIKHAIKDIKMRDSLYQKMKKEVNKINPSTHKTNQLIKESIH